MLLKLIALRLSGPLVQKRLYTYKYNYLKYWPKYTQHKKLRKLCLRGYDKITKVLKDF